VVESVDNYNMIIAKSISRPS